MLQISSCFGKKENAYLSLPQSALLTAPSSEGAKGLFLHVAAPPRKRGRAAFLDTGTGNDTEHAQRRRDHSLASHELSGRTAAFYTNILQTPDYAFYIPAV